MPLGLHQITRNSIDGRIARLHASLGSLKQVPRGRTPHVLRFLSHNLGFHVITQHPIEIVFEQKAKLFLT